MLDHVSLQVGDLDAAAALYDAALGALGYVRVWSHHEAIGYGPPGGGDKLALKLHDSPQLPGRRFHLAFTAADEAAVDAFHAAALARGAADNGAPGPRDKYGPGYYAAFVVDLDGHHLEAVYHAPMA